MGTKKQTTKYDRGELKKEFFDSKTEEVKRWFTDGKKMVYSSYIQKRTKGRSEEKKSIVEEANDKATEEAKKNLAKKFEIDTTELLQMKKNCVELLKGKLNQIKADFDKDKAIQTRDVVEILDNIKRELREPHTITQNYDIPPEEEKEVLSEKDKKAVALILEGLTKKDN